MSLSTESPLIAERSALSFNVEDLIPLIHGSHKNAEEFKLYQKTIAEDPILRFEPEMLGENRSKLFEMMCKKTLRYHELFNYNDRENSVVRGFFQFQDQLVTSLHQGMFIPTILNLGSEKQVAHWIPLAKGYKVMGCYAQTELGHGSDVQNLETVAVFDKESDSFIFNSPSISATKWWIGDLGKVANHVVTQAQLIINNKRFGVQTFIVQVRDLQTHEPLPGIVVGDVGPKYGYTTKDNGYLSFNNVRVPRDNMLAKYTKVNKNGEFVRTGNEKIGYATMMSIRRIVIISSPLFLSQILTIGVRYSLVRSQFKDEKGLETKILNYQLQQDKLIPLIADTYAMLFGSQRVDELNKNNLENCQREDFSLMADLHAILSGCKAVYTWTTLFGGEKVRQACGGQGYSQYSGIPGIIQEFSPMATYEGENTVLLLQTARYLLKNLNKLTKNKPISPFLDYLKNFSEELQQKCKVSDVKELYCPETLRRILRFNSIYRIVEAGQKLMGGVGLGLSAKDSWDKHAGIFLAECSIAHTNYFTYLCFLEKSFKVQNEQLKTVMMRLNCLYGLNRIIEKPNALFESGYLSGEQFKLIRQAKMELLEKIRPDVIGLVEAFLWSDNSLKSALGREDGKVYETLWDWMKNKNKLNKPGVHQQLMAQFKAGLQPTL